MPEGGGGGVKRGGPEKPGGKALPKLVLKSAWGEKGLRALCWEGPTGWNQSCLYSTQH